MYLSIMSGFKSSYIQTQHTAGTSTFKYCGIEDGYFDNYN